MKLFGLIFSFMLAPCVLAGCSRMLEVALFNNTGEAIEVRAGLESHAIAPGKFSQFDSPRNDVFRVSSGMCEYLYEIPEEGIYYKDITEAERLALYERGIEVQVEKDFSIYLLPVSYRGEAPASSETFVKQAGFPLRPVNRTCH